MNDDDDFDPVCPALFTKDYAIGVCSGELTEGSVKKKYSDIANEMIFSYSDYSGPNNIRGLCDEIRTDESPGVNIDIPSYKSNILECGYEIIKVWPVNLEMKEMYSRTLAIQSRGDAYFVFAKGNYQNPVQEPGEDDYEYLAELREFQLNLNVNEIGPFSLPSGGDAYISKLEWANSELLGEDIKWFITNPECLILNDRSWQDWKSKLIVENGGVVSAICGFRANPPTLQGDLSNFWCAVSANLWEDIDRDLWGFTPSVNIEVGIRGWMQTACRKARTPIDDCFDEAVAIDADARYYLDFNKNKEDTRSRYAIRIYI